MGKRYAQPIFRLRFADNLFDDQVSDARLRTWLKLERPILQQSLGLSTTWTSRCQARPLRKWMRMLNRWIGEIGTEVEVPLAGVFVLHIIIFHFTTTNTQNDIIS